MSAGIYVHIPFCLTRCGYCDFNAYADLGHLSSRYVTALLREAELASPIWAGETIGSIFMGGGTPTTLEPADLKALLAHLRDRYSVQDDVEVSIEANPDTVDAVVRCPSSASPGTSGCRWARSRSIRWS